MTHFDFFLKVARTVKFVASTPLADSLLRMNLDDDESGNGDDSEPKGDDVVDNAAPSPPGPAPMSPPMTHVRGRAERLDMSVPGSPHSPDRKRQKTEGSGGLMADEQAFAFVEVFTSCGEAVGSEHGKEWQQVIRSELRSLLSNGTWDLVRREKKHRPVGCR